MKNLALVTTMMVAVQTPSMAGELQNLRSANAEQKRQITELEKQIDDLYSLLDKANRNGKVTIPAKFAARKTDSTYIVKSGDSLSKIAKSKSVSLSSLMMRNNLREKSVLQIGQKLYIPTGTPTSYIKSSVTEASQLKPLPSLKNITTASKYKVVTGDTMYGIARKHSISHNLLLTANPNVNHSSLKIGQVISIPTSSLSTATFKQVSVAIPKAVKAADTVTKTPKVANTSKYKVASGDTMFGIARKHSVTYTALSQANSNVNPAGLKVGQVLAIPSNGSLSSKVAVKQAPVVKQTVTVKQAPVVKQTVAVIKKPAVLTEPIKLEQKPLPALPPSFSTVKLEVEPVPAEPIILTNPMTMKEIADKNSTSVEAINMLNSWNYSSNIKLARGSEVYLPN